MVNSEPKIEIGKKLLELLDQKKVKPVAFLWFYLQGANSWRLFISAEAYDSANTEDNYRNFIEQFGDENTVRKIGMLNISIIPQNDGFLNLLKTAVQTDPDSIGGIRFTSSSINGVFIEDAYIYRLS